MKQQKGIYLTTLRQRRGLSQADLSRLSSVAQNTISKLEARRHARPGFQTVVAIAHALHIEPQRLRFGPDPHAPVSRRRRPGRPRLVHARQRLAS